jgi:hypothetical protein
MGSVQQYLNELADPDRYRPDHCPQCEAARPLAAHGFYNRTVVDTEFDGSIPVRRYLCRCCKRTVSLLPEFALPYLRFSITVIALFLIARLLAGLRHMGLESNDAMPPTLSSTTLSLSGLPAVSLMVYIPSTSAPKESGFWNVIAGSQAARFRSRSR